MQKSKKNHPPSSSTNHRVVPTSPHSGLIQKLAESLFRPIKQWAWKNRTRGEVLWGFVIATPPWLIVQYFSVESFAANIKADWPAIASMLGNQAVKWMGLAAAWSAIATILRRRIAQLLKEEPPGWDKANILLLQQFNAITGHKETRFSEYLDQALALRNEGHTPLPDVIFKSITQPRAQIDRLVEGVWLVFHNLLHHDHEQEITLRTNLALIRDSEFVGTVCHFPKDKRVKARPEQRTDRQSAVLRAATGKRMVVIESILDESSDACGYSVANDETCEDEDGSLICYRIDLPEESIAFVLSIFYGERCSFSKRYKPGYTKILENFDLRLRLEYSLLRLKGITLGKGDNYVCDE